MAKLIKVNGEISDVLPADGKSFTLKELYQHIDCHCVERLPLANGMWMWMDEEGKLNGSEPNFQASALWALGKPQGYGDDYLMGNVLVCGPKEVL